jgi:hypothetical protein
VRKGWRLVGFKLGLFLLSLPFRSGTAKK